MPIADEASTDKINNKSINVRIECGIKNGRR